MFRTVSRLVVLSMFRSRTSGLEFSDALDKFHRYGFREGEPDRAFVDLVWLKFLTESRDEGIARRIKGIMFLPAREIQYGSTIQFVSGDVVGDHFLRLRDGLADCASNALEDPLRGRWLRGDVVLDRVEGDLSHWLYMYTGTSMPRT